MRVDIDRSTVAPESASEGAVLVHPNYVLRIAGSPVSKLDETTTGASDAAWSRIVGLQAHSEAQAQRVCDELAAVIPRIEPAADRRHMLDLRRALHNRKPAKSALVETARRHLGGSLLESILTLDRIHADIGAGLADFERVHGQEFRDTDESMRSLLESDNLKLALSYNNPSLLRRLNRHYDQAARTVDAKTARNHEDSLLQYYARASTKTSPLSSFTLMKVGRWQRGGADAPRLGGQVERRVEAKSALVRHLIDAWLKGYESIKGIFPLTINPTLVASDGKYEFQMVAAGREFIGRTWGTGVSVGRVDQGPLLACIASILADASGAALLADDLVARICALAPKLPLAAVEQSVAKLYGLGYLVAKTELIEQSDLIEWFWARVEPSPDPQHAPLRAALSALRDHLQTMRGTDVERRIQASIEVDDAFRALAEACGAEHGGYLYRTPFYENCYYAGKDPDLTYDVLDAFQEEFGLIHQLNRFMDANQQVQSSLCDYFISRFGEEGLCENVGEFILEFDETYAPLVSEGRSDAEGIAAPSPKTLALTQAKRALETYLKPLMLQGRDVVLDADALRAVIAMVPHDMRVRNTSYSYLVQSLRSADGPGLVLNQIFGGRSGILSRFCEVLDEEGERNLRTYLRESSDASQNVELGGVFGFNANRHPPMSDTELVVAPYAESFADTDKIRLSELRLKYDASEHRLRFLDEEGRTIDVWYHGLLNPGLLPAIHRTIALAFTEGPSFLFNSALSQLKQSTERDVVYTPRISLGKVVLSRRAWLIANSACPDASLSSSAFYLAVREWQSRHGFPDRFFVRAMLDGSGSSPRFSRFAAMKDLNFKDLKPFYVDIRNPRFVRLLQNMMKRHALSLFITELLPDFQAHVSTVEGETHVSELHFEMTRGSTQPVTEDLHWYALRIAYFGERKPLVLGPVAQAIDIAKRKYGIRHIYFAPHWKFGPHINLVMKCDSNIYVTQVLPELQGIIEAWIAQNPSSVVIDAADYEETSRKIGAFELDAGPYLPMLEDNTVESVPYVRPRTILVPEVADSKELMHSECSGLVLALFALKDRDRDAFFLSLHAMLAATAQTFVAGVAEGYMSMRSHADYFFAVHDPKGELRAQFDGIDRKRGTDLDRVTLAAVEGRFSDTGLPAEFVEVLESWGSVLQGMASRSRRIVESNYEQLVSQGDAFVDMANRMREDIPADFYERVFSNPQVSEIGKAFMNTDAGRKALVNADFLAYRINVNLFYTLLPVLEVAPIQKFLMCHLLSNSVERLYRQDWRQKVERILAKEEAQQ